MSTPPTNRETDPQLSGFLPSEIITDILSRLPIRSILRCKCVCKSWLNLLQSREFADFHLSRSASGLVIYGEHLCDSFRFKILEFDDRLGLQHHDLHYNTVADLLPLEFMEESVLQGSANGLLLLRGVYSSVCDYLYVCNPITREYFQCNPVTREYIELPNGGFEGFLYSRSTIQNYGFGVSKMTGQYKVVRILHEYDIGDSDKHILQSITNSICLVYVIGTGMWRRIAPAAPFIYVDWPIGVSLNGNLYWLVKLSDGSRCISCFDLETEVFSTFCLPPLLIGKRSRLALVALGDLLCVCDYRFDDELVIWSMKGYGEEKSRTKEFVIKISLDLVCDYRIPVTDEIVHPIKLFRDGDILMSWNNFFMFYYSNKTKTTPKIDIFGVDGNEADFDGMDALLHTPSFLSLGSFVKETIIRF